MIYPQQEKNWKDCPSYPTWRGDPKKNPLSKTRYWTFLEKIGLEGKRVKGKKVREWPPTLPPNSLMTPEKQIVLVKELLKGSPSPTPPTLLQKEQSWKRR